MKTIAIQRNLAHLKQVLEEHGYRVVYDDEINQPVDAYIYQGNSNNSVLNSAIHLFSGQSAGSNANSTLLINAGNLDPEKVLETLRTRTYSPLFYNSIKGSFN